jgi:hypothetical protein
VPLPRSQLFFSNLGSILGLGIVGTTVSSMIMAGLLAAGFAGLQLLRIQVLPSAYITVMSFCCVCAGEGGLSRAQGQREVSGGVCWLAVGGVGLLPICQNAG